MDGEGYENISYNSKEWKTVQCSSEVDIGYGCYVLQTGDYESCLMLAQSPDSRTVSALGLRMPVLG